MQLAVFLRRVARNSEWTIILVEILRKGSAFADWSLFVLIRRWSPDPRVYTWHL